MKNINKIKCHSKPRPLPFGRAPEGLYPGSNYNDLESHRFLKQQQGEMLKSVQHDVFFYNNGFTLIELLVVVLIIGILAAVAVPQYQKAVEKSRAAQAFALLPTIYRASQTYYLANNTYPTSFDELDVDVPAWTGTTKFHTGNAMKDTRSNNDWSLQILSNDSMQEYWLGRISGPYQGAGLIITKYGTLQCVEQTSDIKFNKNAGDFCVKIMGAPATPSNLESGRYYTLGKI